MRLTVSAQCQYIVDFLLLVSQMFYKGSRLTMRYSMANMDEAVRVRLPAGLRELVQRAVDDRFTKPADYIRLALLAQLKADGYVSDRKTAP
jgi:hypothetical protein